MRFFVNLNMKPRFTRPELLYHPSIPAPMHGVNPRTIIGKVRWDKVRRRAYARNNDCCWVCGVHRSKAPVKRWLEAHEIYDIDYRKGRMKLREIVALCRLCHSYVHRRRIEILVDKKKIQPKFLRRVLTHGNTILNRTGAKPWYNVEKVIKEMALSKVKWTKWHLIFEGKKYYSKFTGPNDWQNYYGKVNGGG